ncbi:DoxX family protein [Bradyrhizobium diazoefficiens]|nr:DoxX family protein [Bradyrhizobium diazoefficiens]QQN62269.1 DoxX family protein [Bradyrhizobium diazoefficiens]
MTGKQPFSTAVELWRRVHALMARIPYTLIALITRISVGGVFWQSGQTKLEGWHLSASAVELFRNEYQLPLIDPTVAAYLATTAEHLFPVLLVIGLATRFAALALLIMTLIIELFVYPDAWPTHGTWAACFLVLMTRGPGVISVDGAVAKHLR